jgi:hypothetical protein
MEGAAGIEGGAEARGTAEGAEVDRAGVAGADAHFAAAEVAGALRGCETAELVEGVGCGALEAAGGAAGACATWAFAACTGCRGGYATAGLATAAGAAVDLYMAAGVADELGAALVGGRGLWVATAAGPGAVGR